MLALCGDLSFCVQAQDTSDPSRQIPKGGMQALLPRLELEHGQTTLHRKSPSKL